MTALALPDTPRLTQNLTHFARALRKAGLPVGPGRVLTAIEAVEAAGFTSKQDFYWTLHAVFVSRPEERQVFAQVFRLFWRILLRIIAGFVGGRPAVSGAPLAVIATR